MSEETMSKEQQTELLFMQLVMMFQGMAVQQLGKVMNPMTQKIERDLGQAKNFIDLLAMLEEKTEGNLREGEQKLLQQALFDLRMNYVDEVKKGEAAEAVAGETEADETEPDAGSESESQDTTASEAESEEGGEPESAESGSEDEGEPESTGPEAKSEGDTESPSDEEPTV